MARKVWDAPLFHRQSRLQMEHCQFLSILAGSHFALKIVMDVQGVPSLLVNGPQMIRKNVVGQPSIIQMGC